MLCPGIKCPHYSKATKYPRKCYYEPQCWKGYADILLALFWFSIKQLWIMHKWRNREIRIKS